MSLERTCPGLHAVPDIWLKQTWVTERKVIAGEMIMAMVIIVIQQEYSCTSLHVVLDSSKTNLDD